MSEPVHLERVDGRENRLTIERENCDHQTYDPRRLAGVAVYREIKRAFSEGDRVQFTAPSQDLHVANRELGTIDKINSAGDAQVRLDSGREVAFNIQEHPHLDHGYSVTSHSSQDWPPRRRSVYLSSALIVAVPIRLYLNATVPSDQYGTAIGTVRSGGSSDGPDVDGGEQRGESGRVYRSLRSSAALLPNRRREDPGG